MPRRSPRLLWPLAAFLTVLPYAEIWLKALLVPSYFDVYGVDFYGTIEACTGWQMAHSPAQYPYWSYLHWAPALVVAVALVARRRVERTAAWTAAGMLSLLASWRSALLAFDLVRQPSCWDLWAEGSATTESFLRELYFLLPALAIVSVVWPSGAAPALRRVRSFMLGLCRRLLHGFRRAVVPLAALTLICAAGGDLSVGESRSSHQDCRSVPPIRPGYDETLTGAIKRTPLRDRELAFLCALRHRTFQVQVPDGVLLGEVRQVCHILSKRSPEPGMLVRPVKPDSEWPISPVEAAYLCPETVAALYLDEEQTSRQFDEEMKADSARADAFCKLKRSAGRPVKEGTWLLGFSESGTYEVRDDFEGMESELAFDRALAHGLIGADGDSAVVSNLGDALSICLRVRSYRKDPGRAPGKWDKTGEVDLESPHGRIIVLNFDETPGLPQLAAAGPGRYRVRAYARMHGLDLEEHLIVVFPVKR